jgi:hypothetical protein
MAFDRPIEDPREVVASGGLDHEGLIYVESPKVAAVSAAVQIAGLLASPEIAGLIAELEATRWTGRPGYPIRSMAGPAVLDEVDGLRVR